MVLPMDTSRALVNTEVKMTYDRDNLYIIAIYYLPVKSAPFMVESLRRDFNFWKNDNFIFFLDPFNDLTNGYTFGANAAGAQWDGTLYEGGKADLNWDNKWRSVVKNYDDKWIFEAAIPFKTIRYKKGTTNGELISAGLILQPLKNLPGRLYPDNFQPHHLLILVT